MRRVILVCGPPCSGKTTYVAQHAQSGDLILDQDAIGAQAMRQGLARVAAMTDGTAWVIRCSPGPHQRDALARQLTADMVLLQPPEPELIARAARRPHPRRHIQAVRDWLRREAEDRGPTRRGRPSIPRGHRTTTQRGYGWEHQKARAQALAHLVDGTPCPFPHCGQPMTRDMRLDYDHYPPLALGGGPRRLTHARCNRQAGQALGVARRRTRDAQHRDSTRTINSRAW